jgi:glutathione S-transferase
MKLYTFPGGPNPRRVHIYLAEKGIEVEMETVDILTRRNREPDFLAKNPTGGIPILELDDGTCIGESVAICRYFEALHPDPPLFGTDAKSIAMIDSWVRRVELNLMSPIGQVWINGHPRTAKLIKQVPGAAEQGRMRAALGYKLLDAQLADNEFIAGDAYSIADAVALATIDFGVHLVGVPYDAEKRAHLKRWHTAMSARPSAKA